MTSECQVRCPTKANQTLRRVEHSLNTTQHARPYRPFRPYGPYRPYRHPFHLSGPRRCRQPYR